MILTITEEEKQQLQKVINFWEGKLTNNTYLLEPATARLLRLTVKYLDAYLTLQK